MDLDKQELEYTKKLKNNSIRYFEYVNRISLKDFELPIRSTSASAGYDFINPDEITILPNEIKYVKTGVKAYFPKNEMLMLCNRSSNPKKYGLILINGVGIVDSDYVDNPDNEGEIAFAFTNITNEPIIIEKGQKLGQGIFIPYFITSSDNSINKRIGGFGSTGN